MGENSAIEWTDHTFNPWWGCTKVSPACNNCYAEAFAKRTGNDVWGKGAARRFFGDKHWTEPVRWDAAAEKAGRSARVFCASMADVFEDHPELPPHRARLWALIERTPSLRWLLLTKRPENMRSMVPAFWNNGWPTNVWAGTTVEDQRRADERLPFLLDVPAVVRFVSCEPLLGPVNLGNDLHQYGVNWVIAGGESGPKHRNADPEWFRSLRRQCLQTGVPFLFKQCGGR